VASRPYDIGTMRIIGTGTVQLEPEVILKLADDIYKAGPGGRVIMRHLPNKWWETGKNNDSNHRHGDSSFPQVQQGFSSILQLQVIPPWGTSGGDDRFRNTWNWDKN
jgi:hypothetical protein